MLLVLVFFDSFIVIGKCRIFRVIVKFLFWKFMDLVIVINKGNLSFVRIRFIGRI